MTIKIENTPTSQDSLPTILWNNIFASGTLTASSEATDYPKENAVSEATYDAWKPATLPASLSIDKGVATAVDSFAVVAHDLGTKGLTVSLQSSTDSTTWTTRCVVSPSNNTSILGLFPSVSARYWRQQFSVKNMLTYTEQADNAVWTKNNVTITANSAVAPDGTTTADSIVETVTAGNAFHEIRQTVSCTASTVYVASAYVKAVVGGRPVIRLRLGDSSSILNTCVVTLSNGAVTSPDSTKGVIDVGNGWYRVWCYATTNAAATTVNTSIQMMSDTSNFFYPGDGTSSVLTWGSQIELGSYPSDYFAVAAAATGNQPIVGVAMAGTRFNFPAGVVAPYKPVWLSQSYELLTATTLGGQFLGNRVLRTGGQTSINLVAVNRTFGETTILPFREHYNSGKAFVWAAGPSVFSKDVGYVWRTEGSVLAPTFDETGIWMSVGMEVYAYGE
jgi:hypothetical protein